MKKVLVILILAIIPVVGMAQKRDAVYLNNGSVVWGKIIEEKENGTVTIKSENGRELEYSGFDIREVRYGQKKTREKNDRGYISFQDRTKGAYFFVAELGGWATVERKYDTSVPMQLSVVNGLRFGQFLSVGVGVGVRYYINNGNIRHKGNEWAYPVYVDLRGNLVSHRGRNMVPYWSLDGGWALNDNYPFISPTIGLNFGGYRNNFIVGVTYLGQYMKKPDNKNEKYFLDALGVKIGFQF